MVIAVNWSQREVTETLTKLYYISKCIAKIKNGKYQIPLFEDMLWIISRVNFNMCKKHCLPCINIDIFNFVENDLKFIPTDFIRRNRNMNNLSEAEINCIKSICNKWKLYGKFLIRLNLLYYKLFKMGV